MVRYYLLICFFVSSVAHGSLVTCPEWNKSYIKYSKQPLKTKVLRADKDENFLALYRAIAAILGSKRMSEKINNDLEKSGYSLMFDALMSLHYRGGLPDDFIVALKNFHKGFDQSQEVYIIDISTQEMLSKLRHGYCKK